ncbi:heavy metal-binding domain-containing protein [Candidatus Bipolaricaulota bacterium]|nr:heavy metal-binding domain-containing protein [Candidatus Bipolaricaulota bacterium]
MEEEKPVAPTEYEDFIVVSSNHVPGYRVVETIGFVQGLTVKSRGLGGRVGSEITEYVKMMENARQEAIKRMIDHARELGANAVISARFDSDSTADVMKEILAYGTAVIVEKE